VSGSARHAAALLEQAVERAAWWLCMLGAAALGVLMMGVTVVDVVLRQLGGAVPGAFEVVTLGMRATVALALPYTFWSGGHVVVELVSERLPEAGRRVLATAAWASSLAVMAYATWAVAGRALEIRRYGDVTAGLGLPEFYYWLPLMVGCGACVPVLAVMVLREAGVLGRLGR